MFSLYKIIFLLSSFVENSIILLDHSFRNTIPGLHSHSKALGAVIIFAFKAENEILCLLKGAQRQQKIQLINTLIVKLVQLEVRNLH